MLPHTLTQEIEATLTLHAGAPEQLSTFEPLAGGCISRATRLGTVRGTQVFLKYGARNAVTAGLFAAEAQSLDVLRRTGVLRVPTVIGVNDTANAPFGWLLLEWLEPGPMSARSWERLGQSLAMLHRYTHEMYGWPSANFIGSLPQSNEWTAAWPEFWRDQRLMPQLEIAAHAGVLRAADRVRIEALLNHLDKILDSDEDIQPALLHGDLWNGNVHGVAQGEAALIDPSSYYGHREVDLAMADLFGGFERRFFEAYDATWARTSGHERRRLAYQLYYLLVHVNLFRGSYVANTMSLVRKLGF